MAYKLQLRYDTSEKWELHNPILAKGEPGIEYLSDETQKIKIGDGVTPWNDLGYGISGTIGLDGQKGDPGEAGPKGDSGPPGKGFSIAKLFNSIQEMEDYDTSELEENSFVLINTEDVEDEDNAKLFLWTGEEFSYLTDLSGAQGIRGADGAKGDKGDPGAKGDKGDPGSIAQAIILSVEEPETPEVGTIWVGV